jgi:hypothetical protein
VGMVNPSIERWNIDGNTLQHAVKIFWGHPVLHGRQRHRFSVLGVMCFKADTCVRSSARIVEADLIVIVAVLAPRLTDDFCRCGDLNVSVLTQDPTVFGPHFCRVNCCCNCWYLHKKQHRTHSHDCNCKNGDRTGCKIRSFLSLRGVANRQKIGPE